MSSSVSRETPPPPPDGAAVLFGPHLAVAERFAELLAGDGVSRGLMGPREVPRLWDRHLLNCALLAAGIERDASVCDVGSGAGLPGLVLAIMRRDLRMTLLEPLLRRATFLQEAVDELGLTAVSVVRGRAEDQVDQFDTVTARAVAPLDRLARWTLPLCRPGGVLFAMKGASASDELIEHADSLRRMGAQSWRVREFSQAGASMLAIEVVAGETESRSAERRRAGGSRRKSGTQRRDRSR